MREQQVLDLAQVDGLAAAARSTSPGRSRRAPAPRASRRRTRRSRARCRGAAGRSARAASRFSSRCVRVTARRQVVVLEAPAVRDVRDDRAVGEPLDRRAVVGEDGAAESGAVQTCAGTAARASAPAPGTPPARRTSSARVTRRFEREEQRVEAKRVPRPTPARTRRARSRRSRRAGRGRPGSRATLSATQPPGVRCERTAAKNSRVVTWNGMYGCR